MYYSEEVIEEVRTKNDIVKRTESEIGTTFFLQSHIS